MVIITETIKIVNLAKINRKTFEKRYVGCLVLTQDNMILLQQRGSSKWHKFPGFLSTFGGGIEIGESPMQALVRELKEELGANVLAAEVVHLGAYTEAATNYSDLVYGYFWHDRLGTITGCYEDEARYYKNCAHVLTHPKVMDDVKWQLQECQNRGLLK